MDTESHPFAVGQTLVRNGLIYGLFIVIIDTAGPPWLRELVYYVSLLATLWTRQSVPLRWTWVLSNAAYAYTSRASVQSSGCLQAMVAATHLGFTIVPGSCNAFLDDGPDDQFTGQIILSCGSSLTSMTVFLAASLFRTFALKWISGPLATVPVAIGAVFAAAVAAAFFYSSHVLLLKIRAYMWVYMLRTLFTLRVQSEKIAITLEHYFIVLDQLSVSQRPDFYYRRALADQEIRLLVLDKRRLLTAPRCRLIYVPLRTAPAFEATSYVWGETRYSQTIQLDNGHSRVTESAFIALRQRQSIWRRRVLWIDAVCINQQDNEEKSRQVALTRQIYGQASRVIGVLGPQEQTYPALNDFLVGLGILEELTQEAQIDISLLTTSLYAPFWIKFDNFLRSPWLYRVWILQEFAAANNLLCMFESRVFRWEVVADAIKFLSSNETLLTFLSSKGWLSAEAGLGLQQISHMMAVRELVQTNQFMLFHVLLAEALTFEASDQRDRVFALLSLAPPSARQDIPIDYSEPLESLCIRATRHILRELRSFSFLCHTGSDNHHSQALAERGFSQELKLPSWVSNLHSFRTGLADALPVWRAAPEEVLHFDIESGCDPHLEVSAAGVDQVANLTRVMSFENSQSGDYVGVINERARTFLREAWDIACVPYQEQDLQARRDAFYRTLIMDRSEPSAGATEPDLSALFDAFEWFYNIQDAMSASPSSLMTRDESKLDEMGFPPEVRVPLLQRSDQLSVRVRETMPFQRFGVTREGRMGLFPAGTKIGDQVHLIASAPMPFILQRKPVEQADDAEHMTLLGPCYVHGIMHGEAAGVRWTKMLLV